MKFGVCIGSDAERLRILASLGFDYAEGGCGAINALTDEEFEPFLEVKNTLDFPMPVANGFIPGDIKLCGPDFSRDKVVAYLTKLYSRLDKLGTKLVIFGSGKARNVPEGMKLDDGLAEVVDCLKNIICPMAAEHGITIVIEPLRTQESNILNTVHESAEIARKSGIPNLKVLADVYHMVSMDEGYEYLSGLEGMLLHAHTSNPILGDARRVYPKKSDSFSQTPFLSALAAVGTQRCSLEAGCDDFAVDAAEALEVLRNAL